MILDDLRKLAEEKHKRVIIIDMSPSEKLMYRDGKLYIIIDGVGTVKRRLFPREIMIVKTKIKNGDYRCY